MMIALEAVAAKIDPASTRVNQVKGDVGGVRRVRNTSCGPPYSVAESLRMGNSNRSNLNSRFIRLPGFLGVHAFLDGFV